MADSESETIYTGVTGGPDIPTVLTAARALLENIRHLQSSSTNFASRYAYSQWFSL